MVPGPAAGRGLSFLCRSTLQGTLLGRDLDPVLMGQLLPPGHPPEGWAAASQCCSCLAPLAELWGHARGTPLVLAVKSDSLGVSSLQQFCQVRGKLVLEVQLPNSSFIDSVTKPREERGDRKSVV